MTHQTISIQIDNNLNYLFKYLLLCVCVCLRGVCTCICMYEHRGKKKAVVWTVFHSLLPVSQMQILYLSQGLAFFSEVGTTEPSVDISNS